VELNLLMTFQKWPGRRPSRQFLPLLLRQFDHCLQPLMQTQARRHKQLVTLILKYSTSEVLGNKSAHWGVI